MARPKFNYETIIYGKSNDGEGVTFMEFKSLEVPDFVNGKDGWTRIVIDGVCDTVIKTEQMTHHDIIPLDDY